MIDASRVRPARGLCVIQMDEIERSPGGLFLVGQYTSGLPSPDDMRGQNIGTVTAIGLPRWDKDDEFYDEPDFEVGDRVRFNWAKTSHPMTERHWLVPQKDVVLKLGAVGPLHPTVANGRPVPSPSPGAR